ncbi:unnamed protein product [Enterobius vermicularis]|uniref:Reelin domain-containing protein n=1 Tax=Enterobius vermicularis TaxID=51028 RepID=A0A0N4VKY2_ENTVE|nr:unnamed protein product [Enterobius vermicularis]
MSSSTSVMSLLNPLLLLWQFLFLLPVLGTIFFHSVSPNDVKTDMAYTCAAVNVKLNEYKFGNKFQLNVTQLTRRNVHISFKSGPTSDLTLRIFAVWRIDS